MTRPTHQVSSEKTPALLETARGVDHDRRRVDHVDIVTDASLVTPQTRECPMCEAPGWSRPGGMRRAVCGSEWHDATGTIETTGPACWMLAHRLDRIEELEHEVREMRAVGAVEVAA